MPEYKVDDTLRQLLLVFISEHYVHVRSLNPGFESEEAECEELLKLFGGVGTVVTVQKP